MKLGGSYWRNRARPIIAAAIEEGRAAGLDGAKLRHFISSRYPFGPREHHPYKVWLDEVRRQLGEKRSPGVRDLPGQQGLFWARGETGGSEDR